MKATGGLFFRWWGFPPKIISLLQKEIFLKSYFDCDRMEDLLKNVPVKIITNDKNSFARRSLLRRLWQKSLKKKYQLKYFIYLSVCIKKI